MAEGMGVSLWRGQKRCDVRLASKGGETFSIIGIYNTTIRLTAMLGGEPWNVKYLLGLRPDTFSYFQ